MRVSMSAGVVPFTIFYDGRQSTSVISCLGSRAKYARTCEAMDEESLLLLLLLRRRHKTKKGKRLMWVSTIFKRRRGQGEFHNLLQEMRLDDEESHFLRMSSQTFDYLVTRVAPFLRRRSYQSRSRPEISTAERYNHDYK